MPKEPQHNQVYKHYWFAAHKVVAIAFVAPLHDRFLAWIQY